MIIRHRWVRSFGLEVWTSKGKFVARVHLWRWVVVLGREVSAEESSKNQMELPLS